MDVAVVVTRSQPKEALMSKILPVLSLVLLFGCTTIIESSDDEIALRPCDPSLGSSESSSSDEGASSDSESSSSGDPPSFVCPTLHEGDVEFCIDGYPCRSALVLNYADADASGAGPLVLYWAGTFEAENLPSAIVNAPVDVDPQWVTQYGVPRTGLRPMVEVENGLLVLPHPDPEAVARGGHHYPWWPVAEPTDPSGTRDDDYVLADAIITCALEQGLAASNRVVTGGMSAGGILVSEMTEQPVISRVAGVVSWSGGTPPQFQPTVEVANPAVMVLHGGVTDVYPQSCTPNTAGCYSFVAPSETFAQQVGAVIGCDHDSGHAAVMAGQGAEFLARARLGVNHPWTGFPVGAGGWIPFPNMDNGSMWVLRNDCDPL